MNKLISIIVPVYNCQNKLMKCINSIRNQTEKNLEIILVDDGSTDDSYLQMKHSSLKDKRIKVLHQNNMGVGAARNRALMLAKGDFVAFIDADDYVEKDYIEKLYKALHKYRADISVCYNTLQYENGKPVLKQRIGNKPPVCFSVFDNYSYISDTSHVLSTCALYKKSILEDIRFHTDLYVGEDTLFFAEAAKKSKKIVRIYEQLYHYVLYSESAFHGAFTKKKLTELTAWEQVCDLFKDNYNVYESAKCAFTIRCYIMIKSYYNNPEFKENFYKDVLKKYRKNLIWFYRSKETSFYKKVFRTLFAICPFICLLDKRS